MIFASKLKFFFYQNFDFVLGIGLLAEVIPVVCEKFKNVHWIIGGSGPLWVLMEQTIERHGLYDRVEMLGAVPHHKVRDVFVRGHIFVNPSLTEAFCIAIVEAASCGLVVVSTNVGGIPEVLPDHMIHLSDPVPDSFTNLVCTAIETQILCEKGPPDVWEMHREVKRMYSWYEVAQRTEKVEDKFRK